MRKKMNQNNLMGLIVGIAVIMTLIFWKLSKTLGLPFDTLMTVVWSIIGVLIMAFVLLKFGLLRSWWPCILGAIYICLWPAINHWALVMPGFSDEIVWWGSWYAKLVVLILIIGGGYALYYWINSRSNNRWWSDRKICYWWIFSTIPPITWLLF